jgi:hypothetical protein
LPCVPIASGIPGKAHFAPVVAAGCIELNRQLCDRKRLEFLAQIVDGDDCCYAQLVRAHWRLPRSAIARPLLTRTNAGPHAPGPITHQDEVRPDMAVPIRAMNVGNDRSYHEAAHLLRLADRERGNTLVRMLAGQMASAGLNQATELYVAAILLARLISAAPPTQRRTLVAGLGDMVLRCALGADDGLDDGNGAGGDDACACDE